MKKFSIFFLILAVANPVFAQKKDRTLSYRQAASEEHEVRRAPYKHAAGLQINPLFNNLSASYKVFFSPRSALELNVGAGRDIQRIETNHHIFVKRTMPLTAGVSYQLHIPVFSGGSFVVGGSWNIAYREVYSKPFSLPPVTDTGASNLPTLEKSSSLTKGIGLIAGLDYKFDQAPINLSLEHRPTTIALHDANKHKRLLNFRLTARYTFGSKQVPEKYIVYKTPVNSPFDSIPTKVFNQEGKWKKRRAFGYAASIFWIPHFAVITYVTTENTKKLGWKCLGIAATGGLSYLAIRSVRRANKNLRRIRAEETAIIFSPAAATFAIKF